MGLGVSRSGASPRSSSAETWRARASSTIDFPHARFAYYRGQFDVSPENRPA